MAAPMSTSINQIKSNPNLANAKGQIDDDPIVKGVIDEMEHEVARRNQTPSQQQVMQPPVEMRTTNVTNFPMYPLQNQIPQNNVQLQHQPQKQLPFYQQLLQWDSDDAQFAVMLAVVAFIMFHPLDTTFIYNKISALAKFQQYDMYIRAAVVAVLFYALVRRFKH
jgi:hypothetical protein